MADMTIVNKKLMLAGLFLSKFGKDALSALGFSTWKEAYSSLTQRTRRGTQRAQETLRPLRQSLCDLCVEMPDAIARPRVVTVGVCPRFGSWIAV